MAIFNIKGHQLTSLKGEVSYFYKKILKDFEGADQGAKEMILNDLDQFLMNQPSPIKVYSRNGECYINHLSKEESSSSDLVPQIDPIKALGFENGQVEFYENYFTFQNDYYAILSVKEFCESISPLEFKTFPDFVLHLQPIEKIVAKDKINIKRKLNYSFLFKGMKDIEAEEAYSEAETLLTEITTDQCKLFKSELFFIIRANTKAELDKKCSDFMKRFKENNGELIREERGLSYFFKSISVGVMPTFKRGHELPSTFLSRFIPHHKDMLFDEGILFESRDGNPLLIDLLNVKNTNYNALVSGSSGHGKSMLVNKFIKEELSSGTKALVLDLGNSFLKNTKFHGGTVLSDTFNPLRFKEATYLKAFVLSCIDEPMSKKEQGRLLTVIKEILETTTDLTWPQFVRELEKSFSGISYYFAELEDHFTYSAEVFSNLTYCDLSNYPESIKGPIIIYLLECFKNMEGRKMFVFDECWNLLQKNADYVAECFRTFRKYGASAIAISQNINDFSSTTLGQVIIQNCFHKFLFKQPITLSEFVGEELKDAVDSVCSKKGVYSEFIYANETIKKPVRFFATCLEYELFTSASEDNEQLEFYMREKGKFLPFKNALIHFTEMKYNTEVANV